MAACRCPMSNCSTSSLLQGQRFFCREWALDKLQHCLEARAIPGRPPGLLVTGGPGAGKTALCTEAVCPKSEQGIRFGLAPRCLASHFCQKEDQRSVVLWRFVLGLVEQLRWSNLLSPGYKEILHTPKVASSLEPHHCQKDPDETFKRAVLAPLLDLPPPRQTLMLVVDSLDSGFDCRTWDGDSKAGEDPGKSSSIAQLLSSHIHLLPSWLLLVCSVRSQNKAVFKMFSGFQKLCLDDLRKPPAVRDIQQYILHRLDQEGPLRRQLTPETADMLNLLHIKSGGCFLFLECVLDGVAASLVGLREIRDIPGTLNGLYLWLCQRLFPRGTFLQVRPLLNVLLAAPKPLTTQELFTAAWTQDTSLSFEAFKSKLQTMSPLLIDRPGGSRLLFHASFAEWLIDVKYCTQKYLCSIAEGHTMLAMALTLQGPNLDTEKTCQLVTNLVCSGLHKDNPSLLALWMLWAGVPSVSPSLEISGPISVPWDHISSRTPPTLVSQEVFQLLIMSGVFPPTCSIELGQSLGVHCVGERETIRCTLERQESIRMLLHSGISVNQIDSTDGQTLLASAAHVGSADVAKFLLAQGADPLISDHQGQTPLILASRQGHMEVLSVLLEWVKHQVPEIATAIVEHADTEGWTPLRSTAWGGHSEAVRLLLATGTDVDGCDGEGRTALRAAAWGGHEEVLLTLLNNGAQVDMADCDGRTPLIAATFMGHHKAVEILLDYNADVNLADGDGRTALLVAALCVPTAAGVQSYAEVASLLLERGADPGHRDGDGMTPLLLAAYEGHEDIVELLLEAGADVDETAGPDVNDVTPLLAAAAMGHIKTVERLLFWGAAVDAIDGEGRTALSLAAARGSVEVVRALLDRGLDENHKDDLGWTPLHAAACEGHRAVCAILTERGSMARVGEMDIEGRSPLILASQEGHYSTAKLLLDRRSPIDHRAYDGHSALSAALLEGHTDVAELFMRRGSNTDVRDAEGRPLLYLLVLEGHLTTVAFLLEKGGVPLESRDSEGRTALHVASWEGNVEAVGLLLINGVNPNAQDSEGRAPLHSVAWRGHVEVGRLLLEVKGIIVDLACNQQGATALSIAAQEGHANIVAMLLDKGANPEHIDKYGRSPVKVAGKRGHLTIVRLLQSYGAKPYPGPLPHSNPLCSARNNLNSPTLASFRSNGDEGSTRAPPLPGGATASSPSSASSPGSTTEQFHSMQSSQNSSTCHSLATLQTVPADSLSFTQQIQQHSLSRSRSRPSTLHLPGSSATSSLRGSSRRHGKDSPPPKICTVTAMVHKLSQNDFSSGFNYSNKLKTQNSNLIQAGGTQNKGSKGKWNFVMASLGVIPWQDCSSKAARNHEIPPLGYPYSLQSPAQEETWDSGHPKNILSSPCYNYTTISPTSAFLEDSVVAMTSSDPHLNLKQAIKLQFEGPTSAALYKRETPL